MDYTELIGFAAAFCTTIAFLPQALKTWRTKSAKDLSLPMFLLFCVGIIFWLIYGVMIMNWPMIVANGFTFILAASILYHKVKYG